LRALVPPDQAAIFFERARRDVDFENGGRLVIALVRAHARPA
jgi:hypothetical protein